MASIVKVHQITSMPVFEGVTIKLTKDDVAHIQVALKESFRADKEMSFNNYVAPIARKLYVALDDAKNGKNENVLHETSVKF